LSFETAFYCLLIFIFPIAKQKSKINRKISHYPIKIIEGALEK
jgi:hypothetical protein